MARRVSVRRKMAKAAGAAVLTGALSVAAGLSGSAGMAFAATDGYGGVTPVANPAAAVNPFLATGDGGAGGQADDFPGPDVPFGMMQWGPDTTPDRPEGGGTTTTTADIGLQH